MDCRGALNHSVHHFHSEVWFILSVESTQTSQGITYLITQQDFSFTSFLRFHFCHKAIQVICEDKSLVVDERDAGSCSWNRGGRNRRMVSRFGGCAWTNWYITDAMQRSSNLKCHRLVVPCRIATYNSYWEVSYCFFMFARLNLSIFSHALESQLISNSGRSINTNKK